MIRLDLAPEEAAVLANLMNSLPGMENARALLPIYDKLKAAMAAFEAAMAEQRKDQNAK